MQLTESTRRETEANLTEVEGLLTDDQRRPISVADHQKFRQSLTTPQDDDLTPLVENPFNEANPFNDDAVNFDPYISGTNNRRSDRELAKMLDLIDNLPISTNGKDGEN